MPKSHDCDGDFKVVLFSFPYVSVKTKQLLLATLLHLKLKRLFTNIIIPVNVHTYMLPHLFLRFIFVFLIAMSIYNTIRQPLK